MPVSELNGSPRASVTFNTAGEVLSVTVREPRFTPADKVALMASRRASMEPRGTHGVLLSEAMASENQFAYKASGPVTDWAQKAIDDAVEAYRKKNPKASLSALRFSVERRDVS